MQLCSELPSNFIFNGEIDYTKFKSFGKEIYSILLKYYIELSSFPLYIH